MHLKTCLCICESRSALVGLIVRVQIFLNVAQLFLRLIHLHNILSSCICTAVVVYDIKWRKGWIGATHCRGPAQKNRLSFLLKLLLWNQMDIRAVRFATARAPRSLRTENWPEESACAPGYELFLWDVAKPGDRKMEYFNTNVCQQIHLFGIHSWKQRLSQLVTQNWSNSVINSYKKLLWTLFIWEQVTVWRFTEFQVLHVVFQNADKDLHMSSWRSSVVRTCRADPPGYLPGDQRKRTCSPENRDLIKAPTWWTLQH